MFEYNYLRIRNNCNDAKYKAWSQQTSEIKIRCLTEFQVYITPLIYDNNEKVKFKKVMLSCVEI